MPCEWLVPYHKIHCCNLDVYAELRHVLSLGKGRATIVSAQHTTTNRQLTIFQAQAQAQDQDQDQDQFCQPWCVLVYTRGIPCKWLVSQTDVNSLEVYIKLRHVLSLGKGRAKLVPPQQIDTHDFPGPGGPGPVLPVMLWPSLDPRDGLWMISTIP